jgi:hypothetical protein
VVALRDVIFGRVDEETELVISTDSSGGIGVKENDIVNVPNEVVGYYTARVALMENMSVGGEPFSILLQNFTGDESWDAYKSGVEKALNELSLSSLSILGSSETNFSLLQSALGLSVVGKVSEKRMYTPKGANFAVIGSPLVGEEVVKQEGKVLPLSLFRSLLSVGGIYEIVPIGSKGIQYELNSLLERSELKCNQYYCKDGINLDKSSGPSTSVLISYQPSKEDSIKRIARTYFHRLICKG